LGLCVLALLLAAFSKELGLIAVPLLVWSLLVFRRGLSSTAFVLNGLLCVGGLVLGAIGTHLLTWVAVEPSAGGSVWTWPAYALRQNAALWQLLAFIVWPVGFSIDHDVVGMSAHARLVAGLLTGLLLLVAVWAWRRRPLLCWAVGWLALSVGPRFLFASNEWVNEHQVYLALPPILLGLSAWLTRTAPVLQPGHTYARLGTQMVEV
jgi:hypothetical protein